MSESKTWFCRTEEDTAEIGRKLASIARRGDCFALYGTLGMSKSALCRKILQSVFVIRKPPAGRGIIAHRPAKGSF